MTTQEMNTNITNANEPAEKKTNKKKAIGIVAVAAVTVAAVIIAMLTACGNKQPTATADEVIGTSVQTVTQVVTDSQGNTHIEEATKVVEVKQTQPATKDPHEGKTWHDAEYKTEQVWVVDEEGYTWQKPIYETHDATICNICGEEITGHITEHDKTKHLPYGDDFSYRCEMVDTLVGYETITVPEKGHYETKTTLVRAAGWY